MNWVLLQNSLLVAAGATALAVCAGLFAGVAGVIRAQTGVVLDVWHWHPVLVLCPAGMIVLGALGGVVPAWKAYRTPIAENLTPSS